MFTNKEKQLFKEWWLEYSSKSPYKGNNRNVISERELWFTKNRCPIEHKIINLYESGFGYKLISKELDLSYSEFRRLVLKFDKFIPRVGMNVVTDKLKKIRSENVKGEKNPFYNWPEKYPHLQLNCKNGIQGRYNGVWLRSTYEYIYAKWLDSNGIIWKYEYKTYKLKDGKLYRPDFFIFENNKLVKIVEVKGMHHLSYDNKNLDKFFELKQTLKDIDVILVDNITPYLEQDKTYKEELIEWKNITQ